MNIPQESDMNIPQESNLLSANVDRSFEWSYT
jgi:hypothetical protein